jgi:RNA 3'-terminal phosphate cyclase (ATP)
VTLLEIDGSHGEGGGQILRTAVSLAAVTGRAVRVDRIRAGRPHPGLAAQHLTAVRAVAAVCDARLVGDALDSQTLLFEPRSAPRAGDYLFDVAEARLGGSAGSVSLVMQALLPPLALAAGTSRLRIFGGTHMAWSPPVDYLQDVWAPALAGLGIRVAVTLEAWGWFPVGQGAVTAEIAGGAAIRGMTLDDPAALQRVGGRAVAANLPAHIPQRMAMRAESLLRDAGVPAQIRPERVRAVCAGAGIFLTAQYENCAAGFSSLGRIGKSSEAVAEEAVAALLDHRASGAALDSHLADQILVPLALAATSSRFTTERASLHLATNAWVIEQFGLARFATIGQGRRTEVSVMPEAEPSVSVRVN